MFCDNRENFNQDERIIGKLKLIREEGSSLRIPKKLTVGDEVRVIAPSRSAAVITEEGAKTNKEKI